MAGKAKGYTNKKVSESTRKALRDTNKNAEKYRISLKKQESGGTIGHIGKTVVFQTSDRKILTFGKMQRSVKGRWASHLRTGKKPRKQFLGPESDQLTFSITLNAAHGVKPRKTVENIEKLIRTGKPQTVVIGKKKVGSGKYVITEMSENWETILNRGEVVKISCDLTLEEYL